MKRFRSRCGDFHLSSLYNCSASGIVVNAPTATSVQPIARLCSPLSFSESNVRAEHRTRAGTLRHLFALQNVWVGTRNENKQPKQEITSMKTKSSSQFLRNLSS